MYDKDDTVIYVGKAKKLKNRVKSYFTKKHDSPKLQVMVQQIVRFEFVITDSEIETVNGVIQLENNKDISTQINSTSGDILIRKCGLNKLKINSVNGDAYVGESKIVLNTEVNIVTTAGDISVEKLDGPWKLVDATSRKGEININWKGNFTPVNGQKVSLKSGGEGACLYAESLSGNIKFR